MQSEIPERMLPIPLYVPNLIGYARIIFAGIAYYVALDDPVIFLSFYTVSFVLDAADGVAARALGQCSRFGAILDMVTDRAATSGFLALLAALLGRQAAVICAALIALDIMSHMVRMYSSLLNNDASHKDHKSPFPFLNLYYGNRKVMGALCVGQEFSYLALYAAHFWPNVHWLNMSLYVLVPLCLLKQWANFEQLVDSFRRIAAVDNKERRETKK